MIGVLVGLALGQDAEPETVDEVIIVYGEEQVRVAREKVISDFERLGYTKHRERDGRLVMLHETHWKGKVTLHDDGFVEFARQGPKGTMPQTFFLEASPLIGWVPCVVVPTACIKAGGVVVAKRKLEAVEAKAIASVAPSLDALAQRHADLHTHQKLEALPAALEACWLRGVPLEGEGTLPDPSSRRQHLLAYWASRTDTVWGHQVSDAVAGYLRQVVQDSEFPITPAELEAINLARDPERQLVLP